uniref:Uncharacterized protein n=1 Tax=Rhizophora mucronata TaxID=61149 RepID=A0A2P2PJ63_RHIMU
MKLIFQVLMIGPIPRRQTTQWQMSRQSSRNTCPKITPKLNHL